MWGKNVTDDSYSKIEFLWLNGESLINLMISW